MSVTKSESESHSRSDMEKDEEIIKLKCQIKFLEASLERYIKNFNYFF